MPNARAVNRPGHLTTGNVLEDLGFSPQDIREMEIKRDLWVPIRAAIEAEKLTQSQLARALQIHQPDASLLLRGQIARFSITRLLQFADRLQLTVSLTVVPKTQPAKRKRAVRVPIRQSNGRRSLTKPPTTPRRTATAA